MVLERGFFVCLFFQVEVLPQSKWDWECTSTRETDTVDCKEVQGVFSGDGYSVQMPGLLYGQICKAEKEKEAATTITTFCCGFVYGTLQPCNPCDQCCPLSDCYVRWEIAVLYTLSSSQILTIALLFKPEEAQLCWIQLNHNPVSIPVSNNIFRPRLN